MEARLPIGFLRAVDGEGGDEGTESKVPSVLDLSAIDAADWYDQDGNLVQAGSPPPLLSGKIKLPDGATPRPDGGILVEVLEDGASDALDVDEPDEIMHEHVDETPGPSFYSLANDIAAPVDEPGRSERSKLLNLSSSEVPAYKLRVPRAPFNQAPLKTSRQRQTYKFHVMWDPLRNKGALSDSVRHHVIISPYRGESRTAVQIHQTELPESSPLRRAVEHCRERGIPIVTGCWKYWHNPIAILVNLDHMPKFLVDKYCHELKRDFDIDIPADDLKCRKSIVLGYSAVELLIQFELAIGKENLTKNSWIRFHNWTAAAGAIFLSFWFKSQAKIALLLRKTQLEDLKPTHPVDGQDMAREAHVLHRYQLELTAAIRAQQIVLAKGANAELIHKQLFKRPTHRVTDGQSKIMTGIRQLAHSKRYQDVNWIRDVMVYSDEIEIEDTQVIDDEPSKSVQPGPHAPVEPADQGEPADEPSDAEDHDELVLCV